jgi:hypothetical protein
VRRKRKHFLSFVLSTITFLLLLSLAAVGQTNRKKTSHEYARELMDTGEIASSNKVATMVCFNEDDSATSFFTLNPSYESTSYNNGSPTKPSFGDESDQSIVGITVYDKGIPDTYSMAGGREKSSRKEVANFLILGTKDRSSMLLMQIVTSTWNFRISGGVSEMAAHVDWHGLLGELVRDPSGISNPGVKVNGHCELAPLCKNQKDGYCTPH